MKTVIAMDSMKGSLSSLEAGEAIARGIYRADPKGSVTVRPLADGGEGTVEALVQAMNGRFEQVEVTGPLGFPVVCTYGILEDNKTAVLEMSGAAGITLVPKSLRNPLHTTTYGVGQVIAHAIRKGCRRFIVGIGGSATNDGGMGMLQALGYRFLDREGQEAKRGAKGLENLEEIREDKALPELKECEFRIACDVTNPLCGEKGCSAVYGPQKGASPEMIKQMDRWLQSYACLSGKEKLAAVPGTGAAGGLGFAFLAFLNGILESGIDIVLRETKLEAYLKEADVVVTGEGRLDGQSAMGKAPVGVARLGKKYGLPVIAFAGSVTREAALCNQQGIDAFFPILRRIGTLEEAMEPENAAENLADTAEQVFRLLGAKNFRR